MRSRLPRVWRLLAALILLASLRFEHARPVVAASCNVPLPDDRRQPLEARALAAAVRDLPLETKVGQLLMPGFVGVDPDAGLLERMARGRVGGVFLLQRNVRSIEQVQALTGAISHAAAETAGGIRPFTATDFEGGPVNALRAITGTTASAAQLVFRGAAGVQAQGVADAETLRYLGFNTNLAPVADVLSAKSTVIAFRSFGADPVAASILSRAYLRGLREGGVLGVMKHFPGHGGTEDDSHVVLPVVERSFEDLFEGDLVPYRQAISTGELQAVMVGHLAVPALDPEMPASLSRATVSGLLRDRLRFDGLVMTDELKMRAISAQYGVGEAATISIQAGVDVILADWTGAEQTAVFNALVNACHSGAFAQGRIDRSVQRIMQLKLAYGLAGPAFEASYQAHLAALSTAPTPPPDGAPSAETAGAPAPAAGEGDTGDATASAAAPEAADPAAAGDAMTSGEPGQEDGAGGGASQSTEGEGSDAATEAEGMEGMEPPAGESPSTTSPTAPAVLQPTATSVSVQPTPVSVQPTPTPAPTRTPTPTATHTATPTHTATASRTATSTR